MRPILEVSHTIESEEKKKKIDGWRWNLSYQITYQGYANELEYDVIIDYKILCQFAFHARNMAFIIGVQLSYFTDDKLEVKEVAVVGLQKASISHWIISPPCDLHHGIYKIM